MIFGKKIDRGFLHDVFVDINVMINTAGLTEEQKNNLTNGLANHRNRIIQYLEERKLFK